jgi:hypothetical protein
MEWKEVGAKILDFAPLLGTLLGGPLGTAGGSLVKLIGNQLGLKAEETTPDNVMQILQTDPAAAVKMRELELTNKLELQKLVLEHERLEIQDRADARARQVGSEKATGRRDYNLYILAYLYTAGFFCTVIIMTALTFSGKLPAEVPQFVVFLLGNLFGTLSAGVGAVLQYFFGSSMGSNLKSQLLAKQFEKGETA